MVFPGEPPRLTLGAVQVPDPAAAPVVAWMFAQRLAGHSAARITRALNDAGAMPVRSRPGPEPAPHGGCVDPAHRRRDTGQPSVHRPAGLESAAHRLRPD